MRINSSHPLVSIVIPCYNARSFIGEAINSALDQTYGNVEVIVIDDGSTDASLDVIHQFDRRIRWETGPNRGGCAARNRGIRLARGEIIQFLDADDLLYPNKLKLQVPELIASGADVVYCDSQFVCDGKIISTHEREIGDQDAVLFVLADVLPTPSALHYRTNLLSVEGFSVGLACAQERDLHLRLACQGMRFAYLAEILVTVRKVPNSVSSDSLRVIDQHLAIALRGYEMLNDRGTLNDLRARALAGWLASDARIYLRHAMHEKARDYFRAARQMYPDGGLSLAYEKPARMLRSVLGPALTERLVGLKRKLVA